MVQSGAAATPDDERDITAFRPDGVEGMVHARIKPRYDAQCVFMYAPL